MQPAKTLDKKDKWEYTDNNDGKGAADINRGACFLKSQKLSVRRVFYV